MNIDSIRARLKAQGWNLLEVPIKKRNQKTNQLFIASWKVVANKNDKSIEIRGNTIDQALNNIGKILGVVSKDN